MLQRARAQNTFIYLIDEIFSGTNNQERLPGKPNCYQGDGFNFPKPLGFISSHDLELSKMEKEFPGLGNWHFRDEAKNNQLVFSYKILPWPLPHN